MSIGTIQKRIAFELLVLTKYTSQIQYVPNYLTWQLKHKYYVTVEIYKIRKLQLQVKQAKTNQAAQYSFMQAINKLIYKHWTWFNILFLAQINHFVNTNEKNLTAKTHSSNFSCISNILTKPSKNNFYMYLFSKVSYWQQANEIDPKLDM
jgi:hypothetical protein